MRRILSLAVMVIIGVLIYNSFYGTEEEKQEVQEITSELKDVGSMIKDLLKSEKEKFDSGKYDDIVDKLKALAETAKDAGRDFSDNLEKIEEKKKLLEVEERKQIDMPQEYDTNREQEIKQELETLLRELSEDLESSN